VFLTPDGPTIVFLTLCTRGRRRWLKSHRAHRIVRDVLKSATAWRAGDYLLMPDHMHLFVSPSDESITLQAWVRYLKSMVSKACANPRWRFQADYWDTRMRTVEQYEEKWRYVRMNPVRAGLADRPEAWPFQGRIEVAYW
jgi:REP element-mobilizing transposase RayT